MLQETANVIQLNSRHFQYNYTPTPTQSASGAVRTAAALPIRLSRDAIYLFTYLPLCKDAGGSENVDRTLR